MAWRVLVGVLCTECGFEVYRVAIVGFDESRVALRIFIGVYQVEMRWNAVLACFSSFLVPLYLNQENTRTRGFCFFSSVFYQTRSLDS